MAEQKRPTCPKCGSRMIKNGVMSASGKPRWSCFQGRGNRPGNFCYTTAVPERRHAITRAGQAPGKKSPVFRRAIDSEVRRFVVTAAQNATPVHQELLAALQIYCRLNGAELLVIPLRYKNPTSRWSASQANEERWADELTPYLWNARRTMNANLVLLGDVKTQPTASSPLTGFDAITHGESGILGHTKLQLRAIPTPQSRYPKLLTTTGAVTLPNYTDSKAGKLGEFHHTLGAVVVEIAGKKFHLRQISADKKSGEFQDLDVLYTPKGATGGQRALALIMGDTHVGYVDPGVEKATFGPGGMVERLQPGYMVWHDLLDGYAANPHHRGNPFIAVAKRRGRADDVEREVKAAVDYLVAHTLPWQKSVVVPANHNDFLQRWLMSTDWRTDPENAEFYLRTALNVVARTQLGARGADYPDPFVLLLRDLVGSRAADIRALDRDESFTVAGIELGLHGDRGPNGARGSIQNLRRLGVRTVIGHSHSPGIDEGAYQTGTSSLLRLEYNSGPSSWMHTHCVVYPSGKRSLINVVDGEWRLA